MLYGGSGLASAEGVISLYFLCCLVCFSMLCFLALI